MANHPAQRSPTPSAYRAGNEGRQMGQGASLATTADPLVWRQSSCRPTSDRKHWQENPRRGPGSLGHTREEDAGSTGSETQRLSISASTTCLYSKIGRQNDASTRNPHHEGPSDASIVFACSRPRGGNHCGQKLLWVPSATVLR